MAGEGFFTRTEAKGALPKKSAFAPQGISVEQLHKLGLRGVRDMNRDAKSPNMEPKGDQRPSIYVLGLAPDIDDDKCGKHFSNKAGKTLNRAMRVPVMWDYICRTMPAEFRKPRMEEIEGFRPSVIASIELEKPKVIIGLGPEVLQWFQPDIKGGILCARGRRFPVKIGSHVCWFHPIQSHESAQEVQDAIDGGGYTKMDDVPGDEWLAAWNRDIEFAHRSVKEIPEVEDLAHLYDGVEVCLTFDKAMEAIAYWKEQKSFALDIETPTLRPPYGADIRILTIALGTRTRSTAFPIHHSQSRWTPQERRDLLVALTDLLTCGKRIIVQNLGFDLEWLVALLGLGIARGSKWECSQAAAFIRNERVFGQSLDYQCRETLGFPLKAQSHLDMERLDSEPVEAVCKYNALDSKYTHPIFVAAYADIKAQGMLGIYREQVRRVPTFVLAQRAGINIDTTLVVELKGNYGAEMASLEKEALKLPEIKKYMASYGAFSLSNTGSVAKVFKDILKRKEGQTGSRYSTDKKVMEKLVDDEPLAKLVLDYRGLQKLKGTYVDRFDPKAEDSYIYPDGKVHTRFNLTFAATGRTSSDDPNQQNWPKRNHKEIRRLVLPEPGHVLVSSDYGQIEARVIAMISKDPAFCDALRKDYDVHMEWAERIIDVWPKTFKARGANLKAFRSDVKNQWVFPLFFGSSYKSVARSLEMDEEVTKQLVDEFWQVFAGVKRWQKRLIDAYKKNGYVSCLTGRRRYAPMSYNMVINTPVQGTASDIVIDAMCRISEYAQENDKSYLQPILNIHDDLTFSVPREKADSAIKIIVEHMVNVPFDFVNVPISIEVEKGDNWYEMKSVGTFRSEH